MTLNQDKRKLAGKKQVRVRTTVPSEQGSDESGIEDEKPATPMTLRAQQFFDSLEPTNRKHKKTVSVDPTSTTIQNYNTVQVTTTGLS